LSDFPQGLLDTVCAGDCLEAMRAVPESCVDFTMTSPPYFNYRAYAHWETYKDYLKSVSGWLKELLRITRPGRRLAWNVPCVPNPAGYSYGLIPLPHDTVWLALGAGWRLRGEIFWDTSMATRRFPCGSYPHGPAVLMQRCVEHLLVFQKPSGAEKLDFPPVPESLKRFNLMDSDFFRDRVSKQVWYISPTTGQVLHDAAYPEALVEPCVRMWSRPSEVVFDPFLGSGTTALAALQWRRHFYGCEWTPEYRAQALSRIVQRQQQVANEDLAYTLCPEFHAPRAVLGIEQLDLVEAYNS